MASDASGNSRPREAIAAVAASDLWVSRVMAGEAVPLGASLLDTYFHVTKADIGKVIASAVAKGAEFADVFFEYRISTNLSFEEDQVKSARRGIVSGVGIRAIKGDQVGYAFSEGVGSAAPVPTGAAASRQSIW